MKSFGNEIPEEYDSGFEYTVTERMENHHQNTFHEKDLMKVRTQQVKQDVTGFPILETSNVYLQEQKGTDDQGKQQVCSEQEAHNLTLTEASTTFQVLKRKACGIFLKLAGFSKNESDCGLTVSECIAEDKKRSSMGEREQLAKAGDYLVLSMHFDDDIGMNMS